MSQNNSGRFQAKLFTQERGGVVAELVGVPVELFMPRFYFCLLFLGQAVLSLCIAFAGLLP